MGCSTTEVLKSDKQPKNVIIIMKTILILIQILERI